MSLSYYVTQLDKQTLTNEQIASILQMLENHMTQQLLVLNLYGANYLKEKFDRLQETVEACRELLRTQGVELTIPTDMWVTNFN